MEHGYDVVATGHNLDDEAAVLLGNVLRWDVGYLGRQHPVLPGGAGVRPQGEAAGAPRRARDGRLLRAARRSTTMVEECPMAAGNRHLGYKDVLNALEDRSPGSKAAFLFGFLERGTTLRRPPRPRSATTCRVHRVRRAHAGRGVRVLPAPRSAVGAIEIPVEVSTGPDRG